MATVRYLVDDVERAVNFYESLGFAVEERYGSVIALMASGDLKLWVSGPESSAARPMPDGARPAPGGWNRFVVTVADLEATVARLRGAGQKFKNEIVSGPGGKQILLEDPSGNPIELFEPRG